MQKNKNCDDYLTARERRIMMLVSCGKTREEIAKSMSLSGATVKLTVLNVREKLDAVNTPHAVALAFSRGIISF